jgi:peptide deformylase
VAIQQIRLFGDPVLRTKAEPVVDFDKELRRLVKDLTETMLAAPGAGLAAPQIGVSLRVFSYNVDGEVGHLINPVLDLSEETQHGDEGCLSIPDLPFPCTRALRVVAKGFNEYGDELVLEGGEKLARCIQHETDHLDGVLFIDRLDRETRKAALRAIRQADWANGGGGGVGGNSVGVGGSRAGGVNGGGNGAAAGAPQIKVSPHPTFGQAR